MFSEIGQRIKLARIEKGLSQVQLAAKVGLSNSVLISGYESGRVSPPLKTIVKIAKILGKDLNYLILGKQNLTKTGQVMEGIDSLKNLIMNGK